MDEVKAIITLRSGRGIKQPVPKMAEETEKEKETGPERIIIREDSMKKKPCPLHFLKHLEARKKSQTKLKFGRC